MGPIKPCRTSKRLSASQNYAVCRNERRLLEYASMGARLSTKECQFQFRNRRWNCSTDRRSIRKLMMRGTYTRETAFVNAVTAAGVIFNVTQACNSIDKFLQCTCARNQEQDTYSLKEGWRWGGCHDNVEYGYKMSRDLMDSKYRKKSDVKTLVMLHNYESGRLAVKNYMRTDCKCHGLSGSCVMRVCWRRMPLFRDVGNRLKDRFDGASKVIPGNDGKSIIPEGPTIKPPGKEDLIYSEDSPNFCLFNRKTGSLGTRGRECNETSPGVDGCELLCCGRGSKRETVQLQENCKCRFTWCCEVTCKICVRNHTISRCVWAMWEDPIKIGSCDFSWCRDKCSVLPFNGPTMKACTKISEYREYTLVCLLLNCFSSFREISLRCVQKTKLRDECPIHFYDGKWGS